MARMKIPMRGDARQPSTIANTIRLLGSRCCLRSGHSEGGCTVKLYDHLYVDITARMTLTRNRLTHVQKGEEGGGEEDGERGRGGERERAKCRLRVWIE